MKKFFGFTLAEVLITLGVIGVVAAMTIPTLMTKISDAQNKTRLKAAYSILSRALKLAQEDDEDWRTWDYYHDPACTRDIYNKLSKYMKVAQNCGMSNDCWAQTKAKNGQNALYANSNGLLDESYTFILMDGFAFAFDIWQAYNIKNVAGVSSENLINPSATLVIAVDVNGKSRPNTLGKDVFMFVLTDKGLIPSGDDDKGKNCDDKSSNNNWDCTSKALGR